MYTWTASNNSSALNGTRTALTLTSAVRAARAYLRSELNGEGRISYYEDGVEIREDRMDMFTDYKWSVTNL